VPPGLDKTALSEWQAASHPAEVGKDHRGRGDS
jgi:hypothetical protein